jgi:hypothetical protein
MRSAPLSTSMPRSITVLPRHVAQGEGAASTSPRQAARWTALASSRDAAAATLAASSRQRLPSQHA